MDFDLHKLKKRPAYPFETIAVGLAFSPRMEIVLAETRRSRMHAGPSWYLFTLDQKQGKRKNPSKTFFLGTISKNEKQKSFGRKAMWWIPSSNFAN